MKRLIYFLLLLLVITVLFTSCELFHTTEPERGKSYALIYGVANYIGPENDIEPEKLLPDNDLKYTYYDAKDMDKYFIQQGFITETKYNKQATKAAMLKDFGSIRDKANANDITVFFFAGHGSGPDIGDGQVFLIPYFSTYPIPSSEIFSDSALLDELQTIPGKKLLILDICNSGGFVPENGVDVDGLPGDYGYTGDPSVFFQTWDKYLNEETNTKYKDIWVIGSAGENELAYEDSSVENGYYTYYLLKSLGYNHDDYTISETIPADRNSDNLITVSEIYNETFKSFEKNYNDPRSSNYAKYYSHTSGGAKDLILLDLTL